MCRWNGLRPITFALSLIVAVMITSSGLSAPKPAAGVGDQRFEVAPGAFLPIFLSRDWSQPLPDIERVVIIQHGHGRNAPGYYKGGLRAQARAGAAGTRSMIIAPDFVAEADVSAFQLEPSVLRFQPSAFESAGPAIAPQSISSFAVYDALLAKLADRHIFPNLRTIVVAGHSEGGQMVQRYAIVGHGDAAVVRAGIQVRYVVANPGTFAYFSADRPEPASAATCPRFNQWKYGLTDLPAYAAGRSVGNLEADYVSRHVIYLFGALDTDPNDPDLNKSCMAEAQGPNRWARGHAFVAYLKARDAGAPNHSVYEVDGVGHNGSKMFSSPCGLTALFDVPGCRSPQN
jgi:hypothetical protein